MKPSKTTFLAASVFCFGIPSLTAQNIAAPNSAELSARTSAPAFDGSKPEGTMNIGPLSLIPSVYYRFTTGDNFRSSPGQSTPTDINEFGLRLNGAIGEAFTVAYAPSWTNYSNAAYEDQTSQSFNATGAISIGELQTSLSQSYSESAPFLSETSQQTPEERWGTGISASYLVNSSLSATIGVDFQLRDSEQFNSSETTTFNLSINRSFASRLNTGLMISKGTEKLNTNFDADFDQISGTLGFQPSDKVYVSAMLGRQKRSFNVTGAPDLSNTIHSLELNYTPVEFTDLSIRSSRTVGASLFSNQTTETENIGIYLNQRLLGWIQLNLGYGESAVNYKSALLANQEVRADDTTFFDARLSAPLFDDKVDLSLFYRQQENVSGSTLYGYDGDQHGIEIGYSF